MADNLTPEQRSYCMSRVRSKDTGPEIRIRSDLHKLGLRFRKHVKSLPGSPDIVFARAMVAVFIDGDFWHGYRFPSWKHKLSTFWKEKITKNRKRDARSHRLLRRKGWKVVRVWEHQLKQDDYQLSLRRILSALQRNRRQFRARSGRVGAIPTTR
jgi:DNA mismatch endonuclease (patch repair protein)